MDALTATTDKIWQKVVLKSSLHGQERERDDQCVDMLKYSERSHIWFKHIWKSYTV